MPKKIFIYAEQRRGKILPVFHELLGQARRLKAEWLAVHPDEEILLGAVTQGPVAPEGAAAVEHSGADLWYAVEHPRLCEYNPDFYAQAAAELCRAEDPEIFLVGSTVEGTELAPTLGVKLHTGVAAHCMDLKVAGDGGFIQVVPAFGGKVLGEILTPRHRPQIATVKPGLFPAPREGGGKASKVTFTPHSLEGAVSGIELVGVHTSSRSTLPVESAEIVFCAGYGIGGEENWDTLEKIAGCFENAALGCTRPALDEGWTDDEGSMIGTSGKTIRPKLYLGIGISGATHHVCGTRDAEVIVSVNKDENAEIFNASDYKVVADSGKILKALADKLQVP